MSRRKQDRPQQWRRTIAEDEEGDTMLEGDEAPSHFDLIKCGDCQADFALSDIVKFIEHKRKCFRTSNGSITSEDPPTLQLIAKDGIKEETDIVTPIAATPTANGPTTDIKKEEREESEEMETARSPMATGNIVRTEKPKIITPIKPRRMSSTGSQRDTSSPRVKQTQTETTSRQSEPLESDNLICLTCKEPFESASALLQHVQEDHGMHIYHQPIPKPPTTPVSESSRQSHSVEPTPHSECGSPLSTGSNKPPSLPSISPYHPHHMPPPPLPVHSPHHFPPHLDGNPFGMFLPRVLGMDRSLPCPPDRMFPGPLNPMLVRDMIHNEHHFHMHPPMPQHPPPRLPPPPPPPPCSSPSSVPTSQSEANMSSIDIYSRKLQELATGGPAQLPPPPPPNRPMSPKKRPYHYSMFPQHRSFKSPFPPKGKACEFCGKQFKFQSNLIVHRRSHTGEKPYKCHLCDHACSQASKLKRHMKTHKKISPSTVAPPLASTGSTSPSSDTQDDGSASNILKSVAQYITDTKSSGGNTSEEDEGDCELEELEKEEAEERATMEREEMEKERERERNREKERESDDGREPDQDQDMENSEIDMPMGEEASDFSMSDSRKNEDGPASLLSEVMKNTGLNEIAQYSEAFRQAVAENRERNNSFSSRRSPSTEDGESEKDASRDGEDRRSPASISQHSPSIGHRSPSIEHRSPSLGQRSPTGSHLDRHPSTSPPSLHSSLESHYARLQEVEQSLHPAHHMESTCAMRELEIVAKRIKVEPTSPSSWVQTATADSAALPRPRSDPYMFSHTNENSPIATNGNLASYYRHGHGHHHENGPTPLPGLPRYPASNCGGGYPRPNNHKGHLLGPRRNDQCEYCGKIFKNCSNLTVHRRSHTGEKPYKCNLCTYACAQSSKLTRHMKTHGQGAKEVFKCEVCGMPFSVYSTLEKHMKKSHWGAIKGTAPKPEPINANAYPTPRKTTSPSQFSPCSPLLSPNL